MQVPRGETRTQWGPGGAPTLGLVVRGGSLECPGQERAAGPALTQWLFSPESPLGPGSPCKERQRRGLEKGVGETVREGEGGREERRKRERKRGGGGERERDRGEGGELRAGVLWGRIQWKSEE